MTRLIESGSASDYMEILKDKMAKTPILDVENFQLKFEPDDLDEFYLKKAALELRETPEIIEKGLKELKELLKGEPDMIVPLDYDGYYYTFLRPCKWYPKSAFGLMKRFYTYRRKYSHYCEDLLPSKERPIFVSGIITPLPRRCDDGARLFLLEIGKRWKPKDISLDEILKGSLLMLDATINEPRTQVSGVQIIFDMDGLSLSQISHVTPSFAKALLDLVQKCLPCRLRGVHIVNQSFIFNIVFAIFKPFLQEKLRKRIYFHGGNRASLLEHVNSEALPERYGGSLKIPNEPIGEPMWEYFCAFEEDFIKSNTFGYNKNAIVE